MFERLEKRCLLSAVLGGDMGDFLTVAGTSGNDNIHVGLSGTNLVVRVNAETSTFAFTDVNTLLVRGGQGDDVIVMDDDVMIPATLRGGQGNDSIAGGAAADEVWGCAGNDTLRGGGGADDFYGGAGTDWVTYSERDEGVTVDNDGIADDGITGGDEGDNVAADVENLEGGSGDDFLQTIGYVANTLLGNGGDDVLDGGAGADLPDGGLGSDELVGGGGYDTVSYASRTTDLVIVLNGAPVSGDIGEADVINVNIENVIGGSGNDLIVGNDVKNKFSGGEGNDTLLGFGGDDNLNGDAGEDLIVGGEGNDSLSGGDDDDVLDGGTGDNTLSGGSGDDDLTSAGGKDLLSGDEGDDTLSAGDGDDILRGGSGDDSLIGGYGADVIAGESGIDIASYLDHTGIDPVLGGVVVSVNEVDNGLTADGNVFDQNVLGVRDRVDSDVEELRGTVFSDVLIGGSANNVFFGEAGNDSLVGNGGRDALFGGVGNDSLSGGTGNDKLYGDAGDDLLDARDGEADELVNGGDGDDTAITEALDTLVGIETANVLP